MKTKRAKKSAPLAQARDEMVMVRLQADEHARIVAAATKRGLGLSALVRMAVLSWLDEHGAK
jgi:predicted HicB family RNase H-like nuclease